MTITREETERIAAWLDRQGNCSDTVRVWRLPGFCEAASYLRALQAELDNTRQLLDAERAAHGATRGVADAAVRGQLRAEERLGKIEAALAWSIEVDASVDPLAWMWREFREEFDLRKPDSVVDALIRLHERASK